MNMINLISEENRPIVNEQLYGSSIKIGFLLQYSYSGRGGTEQALINLVQGLQEFGVEVHILYISPFGNSFFLEQLPAPIDLQNEIKDEQRRYKLLPPLLRKIFKKKHLKNLVMRIFKKQFIPLDLDILVILDLPYRNAIIQEVILDQKSKVKTKVYSWIHALTRDISINDRIEFKAILQNYDGHLAISKGIKEELQQYFDIPHPNLIYNPVPYAPMIKRDKRKFLFIGRIAPIKQVPDLLTMMLEVNGHWSLDIFGTTGSDVEDIAFLEYIKKLGLAEKIVFHGWVDDPWSEIKSAGALLLNSLNESFGLVLVEAMMRGIPCISSDCPVGPREVITEGVNGWLYPLGDKEKFLSIVQKMIDGTLQVPDPMEIQNSILKFETKQTTQKFLQAVLTSI